MDRNLGDHRGHLGTVTLLGLEGLRDRVITASLR